MPDKKSIRFVLQKRAQSFPKNASSTCFEYKGRGSKFFYRTHLRVFYSQI